MQTNEWLRRLPTRHMIILLAELAPLANQDLDGAAEALSALRGELRRREWSTDSHALKLEA